MITLLFSFLMGMTVLAAPTEIPQSNETEDCVDKIDLPQLEMQALTASAKIPVNTPRVTVSSITVWPRYTIPGDNTIYYGGDLCNIKATQPTTGGWSQGLALQITRAKMDEMQRFVTDKGNTLIGYRYDIVCQFTGPYTYGRYEITTPEGFEPQANLSEFKNYIFTIRKTPEDPFFSLIGGFFYTYNGKNLSQSFNASAYLK